MKSDIIYADLITYYAFTILFNYLLILCIDDKYKKTKKFLQIFSFTFFVLQGLSMVTVMTDINYQFLVNLFDFTSFIGAFKTNIFRNYIAMGVAIIIFTIFILYFIHKYVKIKNKVLKYVIITVSSVYLVLPISFYNRFVRTVFDIIYNPYSRLGYKEIFKDITGTEFVDKKELIAKLPEKPKNLVLIILESTEQTFMNEKVFGNIAGDIKKLTKEGEFYSGIPEIQGSNWTMAGIHTLMCGSPRLYNIRKNKLFSTVTVSELICFSDVLKIAGYNQFYLGGEFKTFSGKSFFLELHGYDTTWGDKEIFKNYDIAEKDKWGWGAKDLDVFKIAKDKYVELSKQNKPFNLTFSTIDAHAPEGIYDDRCKNSTGNSSLDAIECTNDGLKDFMGFIKQQPNYKDTIVVVIPDHLMMISKATGLLEKARNRSLFALFLNTGNVTEYNKKILYTDVAKIILDKLNIENNAKFIMYNYKNESVDKRIDFLNKNADKIQTFNQRTIMQN